MNFINSMVLGAKVRMLKAKEALKNVMTEEKGVSNIVATVLIIIVAVALVALMWTFLKDWIIEVFTDLLNFKPE
ncbi:MAG: hypothetical protein IJA29_08075 [Lachnospiraceae bacterium]|nr:hypothetical protein [Lachnospiraceae bacterium]